MGLVVLASLTWRQVGIWRDSVTLWTHVISIDQKASLAHNNLGTALFTRGELDEAIRHYRQALKTRSGALVYYNLANAQTEQGRLAEAKESYLNAIQLNPDLAEQGKTDEAVQHYQEALRILKSRPKAGPD